MDSIWLPLRYGTTTKPSGRTTGWTPDARTAGASVGSDHVRPPSSERATATLAPTSVPDQAV